MLFLSSLRSLSRGLTLRCRAKPNRPATQLVLEPLEDRMCPSGGYLLVGSYNTNSVLRYNESTGAFVDQFDPNNLASLINPVGGVFGADGNLYVSSGIFQPNPAVLQYNCTTGAFQSIFASQNITSPRGVLFGPDGNLYVADGNTAASGDPASIERFDGKTGTFLNYFVSPTNNSGLEHPTLMVFGPDGSTDGKLDLYVSAIHQGAVYRYDGTTGAFKGLFVPVGSGGLDAPAGLAFGPDGNLYVSSSNWFTSSNGPAYVPYAPPGAVLKFEGPSGPNPGAFLGTFIAGGYGGLANPYGLIFGPDPSGNGNADLYVASSKINPTGLVAQGGTSQVLRYDATTGAFLGTFVSPGSGGLKFPTFLTFTETNPTTLNYGTASTAASVSAAPAIRTASAADFAPLASSVLGTGQPTVPARPLLALDAPSAPRLGTTVVLPTTGTTAAVPAGAVDAVFAASHAAVHDDAAWLFAPLPSNSLDAL